MSEWRTEDDPDYPESVNWFGLYAELTGHDSCKELVDSTYPYYDVKPSRNSSYEKSFYKKGDLHTCLIREQIKRRDPLLPEYMKDFSFAKKQIKEFIAVAQECNNIELSSFLSGEMEKRSKADL